jgi:serine/threonine-protein kinase
LTTQREIASEITNKLRLKLSGESEQKLAKKYTTSNEAYQLYLRGRYHFARRTKDDIFKAIEYYERAIKLDSDFALAYAHLADLYNHVPNYPYISPNESVPKAKQAARRALEIDPQLPEAYAALANSLAAYDWDWVEAERSFKKAIELDPNNALVRYRYATEYLLVTGRDKEAIAEVERATELDPLDINIATGFSRIYIYSGEPEKALEQARKVNDLDPNFIVGQWILCRSYNLNGLYEDTIKLGNEVVKKNPDNQVILAYLGVSYAKSSRREEAEEVIKRFREIEKTGHVISYLIAQIYIALNDRNSAFAELNRAFEKKDTWLKLAKVDPFLKDLRQDPRYKDLLKRMNLPE